MDDIYKMKLHQVMVLADTPTWSVLKVPGGWIYTKHELEQYVQPDGTWSENYKISNVFVPEPKKLRRVRDNALLDADGNYIEATSLQFGTSAAGKPVAIVEYDEGCIDLWPIRNFNFIKED